MSTDGSTSANADTAAKDKSADGPGKKCKSNILMKNAFAVPLWELFTLDVVIVSGSIIALCIHYEIAFAMMIILVISALAILAFVEYKMNVPSNLVYYFGCGKTPHRFKVCKCKMHEKPSAGNNDPGQLERFQYLNLDGRALLLPDDSSDDVRDSRGQSSFRANAQLNERFVMVQPGRS
jgi:hypothetical protein